MIVYMPGVWDLLHVGHLRALERASRLGFLIVGVPGDKVVLEDKGSPPVIPCEQRVEMLRALSCVSAVVTYDTLDFIPNLTHYSPDILAVGSTWGKERRHIQAEEWCIKNGKRFVKIEYTNGVSTTEIKNRVLTLEVSRILATEQRQ